MYFEFINKTKLCAGEHALSHLEYECHQYHMKHPLIITDEVLYQLKYIDIIKKYLFSTINKQPTALLEWQRFFNIETSISK